MQDSWQVTWREGEGAESKEHRGNLSLQHRRFWFFSGKKVSSGPLKPEKVSATEVRWHLKQGVAHLTFRDEAAAEGFLAVWNSSQTGPDKASVESKSLVPGSASASTRADQSAIQVSRRVSTHVHDFEMMSAGSTLPKATGRGLSTPEGDTVREAKRRAIETLALTAQETPEKPGNPARLVTQQAMRRAQPARSGLLLSRQPSEPQLSASYGGYRSQVTFGLKNLGNTCYLNAVVQAVRALREFVTDLRLLPRALPGCREGQLYGSTLEILHQMSSSGPGTGPCNPAKLREHIAAASPMFSGSAQQDAHEFFLEYVNQLHDELLATRGLWLKERGEAADAAPVPATQLHLDSEVQKRLQCIQCQRHREVSERFRDFSVDFSDEPGLDRCSLSSMVASYFAGEMLEAKCEHCGAAAAHMDKDLVAPPRVLVLHLKRFVPNLEKQRYDKRHQLVDIPLTFDLGACLHPDQGTGLATAVAEAMDADIAERAASAPCPSPARLPARPFAAEAETPSGAGHLTAMSPAKRPASEMAVSTPRRLAPDAATAPARAPPLHYGLRAVVAHDGSSPHSGHYVCYARGEEGRWRLYDDSFVRDLGSGEDLQQELGRKAYIVFFVQQGQEGKGRAD